MHISSLPGKYGCGSFGDSAKTFINKLAECGFSYWQLLPLCVPDSHSSPYSSVSVYSGNPFFIDLDILYRSGLLSKNELMISEQTVPYACEFDRLRKERLPILFSAAKRAYKNSETVEKIDSFMLSHRSTAEFCRFMAIKEANGGAEWLNWKTESYDKDVELAWRFIQYEFFRQWTNIKNYANERGIKIIGDIPFYVSLDSSDVYSDKKQYQLSSDGRPSNVSGVPPDYFSEDGQLWGNPLYDWDHMKSDNYRFWRERLEFMLTFFDGVRIDHFRAIESYYSIPGNAVTAKEGSWRIGPGIELINVIKEVAKDKLIIAEDLGDITESVRLLLDESGFPGMRVMQFGFLNDGDSLHRPHHYPENCVAYTGTHDNNTLLGSVWEMPPERRRDLFDYCCCPDDWSAACVNIIKCVLGSRADTVIIPIQDILVFGADTRMNRPGIAENNWTFRITDEQLESINSEFYKRLNFLYGRN